MTKARRQIYTRARSGSPGKLLGFDYRSALRRLRPDLAAKLDELAPRHPINAKGTEDKRTLFDGHRVRRRSAP